MCAAILGCYNNPLLDLVNSIEAMEDDDNNHPGSVDQRYSRHNKPKKDPNSKIEPHDYECDENDEDIIKSFSDSHDKRVVVRVGDAFVDYFHFKCLLKPSLYLNGDVINAYIELIKAENHLLCREGSTVYIENTLIVGLMHRDAKIKKTSKPTFKEDNIIDRITTYVSHDMVFLPINIEESHWYLAVINAKKRQIQVLDSMKSMSRKDLELVIQIDIASRAIDLTSTSKWPDLKVSSWEPVEQFSHQMQTDGVSCGLFLLNFIEYWTGESLSDDFTQSDMFKFRLKLGAILLDTPLNTARDEPDILTGDETDDPVEVFTVQPTQLRHSMYKDTTSAICDYILSITDGDALGKEWVRSSHPHLISISLRQLHDMLNVNKILEIDIFNLAVRMLACDDTASMRNPKCHFMDLKFNWDCNYKRHPLHRKKHPSEYLAKYFADWPNSGVCFEECELVLVPWYQHGAFGLFALDRGHRVVTIMDPSPVLQNPGYTHPSNYYIPRLHRITYTFDRAMDKVDPSWNDDVFYWKHVYPELVPLTFDWCSTGFIVIELINMWDGHSLCRMLQLDPRILRKWLLIDILKCKFNESAHNIPDDVRAVVHYIRNTYVERYI
ncbi:unnamed protein product [Urochloa decumbens]|uniref:Ubiquitin-like protease family profile domain-containing protein n=1 Tax=Urochloa decumbens TaxID=240449 RepID=A0ABC8ZWM7_9POAL